jgi:hypothetical protein
VTPGELVRAYLDKDVVEGCRLADIVTGIVQTQIGWYRERLRAPWVLMPTRILP